MSSIPKFQGEALQSILGNSPYFHGIPRRALEEITRLFQERFFEKGSIILRENGRAHRLFILSRGVIALSISRGGGEIVTEIIKRRGDLFGWSALVPPRKYTATAKALENSRVLSIEGKGLEKIFQRYPSWGWLFLKKLSTVIAIRLHHTRSLLAETLS